MDLYFMADLALQGFIPGIFLDAPPLWLAFWMLVVVVIDGIIDACKSEVLKWLGLRMKLSYLSCG